MPQELVVGQEEPWGGGGGGVAGQVRWCGCWWQLLPTAGQGLLSELRAPGSDPGLGGEPRRGQAESLPNTPPPPSFPGTLLPLPTELRVAESAGLLGKPPPPMNKWGTLGAACSH